MTILENNKPSIPANVRVMLGLIASPTLMVIGMLFYTIFTRGWQTVTIPMIVFSVLGAACYYIVITGKLPGSKK